MTRITVKPVRRPTLSEDICEQLVNLVAKGDLVRGEKLPSEHELMRMFSVGRSSIREALRALALLGVVETRQGNGTYVCKEKADAFIKPMAWRALVSVSTGLEILEARKVIEVGSVELAASHAGTDDMELLEHQLREMEANVSDALRFAKLDLTFHLTIAEIAGNSVLLQFVASLREVLHEYILEDLKSPGMAQLSLAQHRQIVEAIGKGDVNLACQAMRRHLEDVSERLLASISNRQA